MIEISPRDFLGLLGSCVALGFFLGLVWIVFLHWSGLDI